MGDTPVRIYTAWAEENFYVAFKVGGVDTQGMLNTSNMVNYQFRRAWGEDLCQILIQGVFDGNTLGPTLHVVCKRNAPWVERKEAGAVGDEAWHSWDGSAVRYAARIDPTTGDWRGEVAIPWTAICPPGRTRPPLLRFNFIQHQAKGGQTTSWAGPIDFGRDDRMMGILSLQESRTPGMGP